ncbi:MAG: transglycosylase SLT domain-containing protein, partial [Proteobacteria bacterium]|nr:transglycosylase SLT domain-containing protein [Pseudomonadota bacterium]
MSFKKILVNTLLAVVCALPLASIESRFSLPDADLFSPKRVGLEIHDPGHVGLRSTGPDLLDTINEKMRRRFSPKRVEQRYDRFIHDISRDHGISPALVKAVIKAESGFDPNAVSSVGAVGLMQIMP